MPLQLVRNDITRMNVDAIVNAANPSLLGGGGVDGAIHRAAGPKLLEECRTLGGCRTGEAKLTRGYDLPCKYVIHTVGPVWEGGGHGERALLSSCYLASLALADEMGCESVAFPLISSGVYGYPKEEAMHVAIEAITQFLLTHEMTVYLTLFSRDAYRIGGRLFRDVTAYIDDVYADEHDDSYCRSRSRFLESTDATQMPERAVMSSKSSRLPAAPCLDEHADEHGDSARRPRFRRVKAIFATREPKYGAPAPRPSAAPSLDEMLSHLDAGFAETLLRLIDERGMTDAECYKRANVDRRLFNKIKNNPDYRPGKPTVLAFAIALRLTLEQTNDLLTRAGYALSRSSKFDVVVTYCISNNEYDLMEINTVLFDLDLPTLGC